MKRIITSIVTAVALAAVAVAPVRAADVPYLSLSGGVSQEVNSTFTVEIFEDSGSAQINVVTAKIAYDPSKLQFVSFSDSGSAFDTPGPTSTAAGSLSYTRGLAGGTVTGYKKVGAVAFKALASSGSATINIAPGSKMMDPTGPSGAQNIWTGNANNAALVFTAPPAGGSGGGSNTSNGGSTGNSSSNNSSSNRTAATGSTSNSSQNSAVESENTQATENNEAVQPNTAKDDGKKSDDKKADDKKTSEESSSGRWLWFLVILAAIALYTTYRRRAKAANPDAKTKQKAAEAEKAIVAAVETAKAKADAKAKDAKSAGAASSKKTKNGKSNKKNRRS